MIPGTADTLKSSSRNEAGRVCMQGENRYLRVGSRSAMMVRYTL